MGVRCPKCHFDNTSDSKFCKDCGTQLLPAEGIAVTETLETPKEELTTGSTFAGRYQIIEELGKGGMGRVYKVLDKETKEKIALKLIKPEIASDKKTIERFRNELITARKISQKNVCRMYDLNREKDNYYITMEYVSGGDLKKFIRRSGQMGVGKAISIAKQICDGLKEAHDLGIVHRDLKPNNIMIDDNGNARIMDFGIARTLKTKGFTGSGVMIGTPEYMSPEQVEAKEVDQLSDIYSLGVIMYEMLTGRLPFEADTPFAVGVKHKSEIPKDPKELNPQIPEDLSGVILKCLEKEKENRYQNAGEVRSGLEKIEQGLPKTDRVIPKKTTITSREITVKLSLKRFFIPSIIICSLLAIALILWSPWSTKTSSPIPSDKPSIAVLPFEDSSPEQDQRDLCDGIAESIILALSRVGDLRVPASTSSFSLRGKDIKEIGEKLKVSTVLKGTLQKAGNTIRVRAQLINIADDTLMWGDQFDAELVDIFVIQDEITLKILEMLKVKLLGEEKAAIIKRYTENIEAYNLYIQGRSFWKMRTKEAIYKAIEYMKTAIELDPEYALAYAGLADAYILLADWSFIRSIEGFTQAEMAAAKALELDASLAEAHNAMAVIHYMHEWNWPKAEEEFKKAISLNPNYASAHQEYGEFLTCLGRFDEAFEEFEKAQQLDPLSPIISAIKAWFFYYSREYDMAIQHSLDLLEINPNYRPALVYLGWSYEAKGMNEEALSTYQKINFYEIGIVSARLGEKTDAIEKVSDLVEKTELSTSLTNVIIAKTYFVLGDKEKGFSFLEKAIEERNCTLRDIQVAWEYDSVRSDARFKSVLKRMNLE